MRLRVLLGVTAVSTLIVACLERPTQPALDEVESLTPWVAHASVSLPSNRMRWAGDEHNRVMWHVRRESKRIDTRSMSRADRCKWLIEFVLAEMRSDRAAREVVEGARQFSFAPGQVESATNGYCSSTDSPQSVKYAKVMVGQLRATPINTPNIEEGDTLPYYPSAATQSLISQIDWAAVTSSTPAAFDQAVVPIVAAADTIWDGENVIEYAAIAVSSAYYWQSQLGGSPTQGWQTDQGGGGGGGGGSSCPPDCMTFRAESSGTIANGQGHTAGDYMLADAGGAAGIFIGTGFGASKFTIRLARYVFLSNGASLAVAMVAGGVLASGLLAMT